MKMIHKLTLVLLLIGSAYSFAEQSTATLRSASFDKKPDAPIMPKVENRDIKRQRNYPMQPPTIPHKVRDYRVDLNSNKCLSCHSRKRAEESQAPMISVTHYMNREGNFLADVSPRRYFCNQCHVVQNEVKPLVENEFTDMDTLIDK